ncbi:MAG: amidohydrolase family protein [Rhodothermales bacterium]
MNLLLTLTLALGLWIAPHDGDERKAKRGTFALTNARIETVTNGTIERGTLIIENDRITAIGTDVAVPSGAEVIDLNGQSIYPGMIDSGTRLGLSEVGSVDLTEDFNEIGDLTPHVKALTAVNPNSVLIPVTRVSGVTTVITEPVAGLLPGQAALINLHGYTPEQMYAGVSLMTMTFPATGRRAWWDQRSEADIEKAAKEAMKKLNDTWEAAQFFARIDSAYTANPDDNPQPDYVPSMQSMVPVVRGEMHLLITVNMAKDIQAALKWVEEQGIDNVILTGLAEGWRVADEIAASGIPCLVGPVLSVPTRQSDRFDKAYANAGLMHQAGVKVAIRTGEIENVRNLPFNAGFAAAYGLGKDEALRAVTIVPAEIFGVADDLGSLEVGKKATLFVSDGDPFETRTNINHVFIDGWMIPMESRHTRLYDEFLERSPGLDTN